MGAWGRISKVILKSINSFYSVIKSAADCVYSSVNLLDVKVILKDWKIISDLYVKPRDTHQYLDSLSCHLDHCKSIYYLQPSCAP